MTAKRFKKVTEVIHCNDNTLNPPRGQDGHDKLHKLPPLIDKLNARCTAVYKPSGTVAVDESMIAFKGRNSLKQYMPLKPIKRGYKVWNLADSSTGYVLSFDVYAGNNMDSSGDSSETGSDAYGLRERVVINLCSRVNMQPWTVVTCGAACGCLTY